MDETKSALEEARKLRAEMTIVESNYTAKRRLMESQLPEDLVENIDSKYQAELQERLAGLEDNRKRLSTQVSKKQGILKSFLSGHTKAEAGQNLKTVEIHCEVIQKELKAMEIYSALRERELHKDPELNDLRTKIEALERKILKLTKRAKVEELQKQRQQLPSAAEIGSFDHEL